MPRTASKESLIKQKKELEEKHRRERQRLERQLKELEDAERLRLGALAEKAGLSEIEISDEVLQKEFEAIAARFRSLQPESNVQTDDPAPSADTQDAA